MKKSTNGETALLFAAGDIERKNAMVLKKAISD